MEVNFVVGYVTELIVNLFGTVEDVHQESIETELAGTKSKI